MAQRKVVLVHTSFAVIDLFNKLFDELKQLLEALPPPSGSTGTSP